MIPSNSKTPSPIAAILNIDMSKNYDLFKLVEQVTRIRCTLNKLGIDYWTVGQCRGNIHIFIKRPEDAVDILKLLEPDEEQITYFTLL